MIKGKEQCLVPEYILKFLEKLYLGIVPEDYGQRMVSRTLLSKMKALYHFYNDKIPSNFGRLLCPEYLIEFIQNLHLIEFNDDNTAYIKEVPEGALRYAYIFGIGGMSYRVEIEGVYTIQNSATTSVTSKDSISTTIDTLSVPAEVQALPGYGWGINDSCFNYVDFENKKFVQKVERVVLNKTDYTWRANSNEKIYYINDLFGIIKTEANNQTVNALICDKILACAWDDLYYGTKTSGICVNNTNNGLLGISASDYESLSEIIVYYELAEPIETDISEYLPATTQYTKVYPGGTLIFNNEHEKAVPSLVQYLVEV